MESVVVQLVALRSGPSALNIDDRDSDRCTPLHLAIINGAAILTYDGPCADCKLFLLYV